MGLATGIAEKSQVPLPLGEAAQSIYSQSIDHQPDLARKDFSSVYQYLQKVAQDGKKMTPLGRIIS